MEQLKKHKYMQEWITMYNKGYSFTQIAKEYNVAMTTVKRRISSYVDIRPKSKYISYAEEWLELFNSGVRKSDIARMYRVSPSTVGSILNKVGIERKGNKKFLHLLEKMKTLYANGKSLKEISEQLNLSTQLIADYLEFDGVSRRPYSKACRSYDIDENIFESIDNVDTAFVMGILWVIGNVIYDEKIARNIRLVTTDKVLISTVLSKIYIHDIEVTLRKSDNTYRKDIQCVKIKDDLIKLGFSNKGNKQVPVFENDTYKIAFMEGLLYSRLTLSEKRAHIKYLDEPLKNMMIDFLANNLEIEKAAIKGASMEDNIKYNSLIIFKKECVEKIHRYYYDIVKKYNNILKG